MRRRCSIFTALLPLAVAVATCLLPAPTRAASSVAFSRPRVAGVRISLVTVDLSNPNVRLTPAIARNGIGTGESFRSILRRTRPAAAINGTFFCTRTLKPTGDIVIDGHLLAKGGMGTAVAISSGNRVSFLPTRRPDIYSWDCYEHVIAAGPTLVMRGRTIVQPRAEGFKSRVHYSKRVRSAVGLTYHNKLVMVATHGPVYLSQLARVMKTLKCVDAATLDGGSSTGLYWKGKLVANPQRSMTNCLLVYDRLDSYEQHRTCFYPTTRVTSAPSGGS